MRMLFKSSGGSAAVDEWVEEETTRKGDGMSGGGWSNSHQMLVFLIKHNMPGGTGSNQQQLQEQEYRIWDLKIRVAFFRFLCQLCRLV